MSILASTEVRWIMPGLLAESSPAWKWFFKSTLADRQKDRPDTYVVLPGVSTVGIKWREGELQFKVRVRDLGMKDCARGVKGRVECWEKWSREGDAADDVRRVARSMPQSWATVTKTRIERKFAFDGSSVHEVDAQDKKTRPVNGCNVELTKLRLRDLDFWTFGFEAFADAEGNEKCLDLTLDAVLNEVAIPSELLNSLSSAATHSYPSWLATMRAR